jgi:predicted nucleic acid-binding protein
LQRPLDDRTQPRINIEAEAILTLLGIIENSDMTLVSSEVLDYELSRILDKNREDKVREILSISNKYIKINNDIELTASKYNKKGIKPMDALHLACAINMRVDYFCTTDDKFLNRAKNEFSSITRVCSPLELIVEVTK